VTEAIDLGLDPLDMEEYRTLARFSVSTREKKRKRKKKNSATVC